MTDYQDRDPAQRIKEPPKSAEAEQAVIGAVLLDPNQWPAIAERINSSDFFYENNRVIFQAMQDLSNTNSPIDIRTVAERLRSKEELETAGGLDYLQKLGMETPSADNAQAYAAIISEQSIRRRLIAAAGTIANSAYFPEGRGAREVLDTAESTIFSISKDLEKNTSSGLLPIEQTLADTLSHLQKLSELDSSITGLSTGLTELDNKTAGLQRGDLIIIGGRPSMGKTAFSLNLAQNVALSSKLPVAIFSLEMPARSLMMRMISSLGKIPSDDLRRGNFKVGNTVARFQNTVRLLNDTKIFIDDTSGISITELRARCRRLEKEEGQLGLILIDYLQLMQIPDGENRATQIGDLSRGLKLLAKELDVPVVVLSQLNRGLENRTDKRPIMSDLRESGAIEQDADVIMFVYRHWVYDKGADPTTAEIIIGKQRNGPIGDIPLRFIGEYSLFTDAIPQAIPMDYE